MSDMSSRPTRPSPRSLRLALGQEVTILGLRKRLIEIASHYQRIIFILGREYLEAIGLPLPIEALPPTLAYIAPSIAERVGDGINIIRIGLEEQQKIGAHWSSAKEKRFLVDVYRVLQGGVTNGDNSTDLSLDRRFLCAKTCSVSRSISCD